MLSERGLRLKRPNEWPKRLLIRQNKKGSRLKRQNALELRLSRRLKESA